MADIRINALANTASSSASDDFLALDGTTNGTRKLNAYSPSFGGNATVGGNLTVSGTGTSSAAGRLDVTKSLNLGGAAEATNFLGFNRTVAGTIQNSAIRAYNLYNDGSTLNIESYSGAGALAGTASLNATQFRVNDSAGGSKFAVSYSSGDTTLAGNLTVSGGTVGTAASTDLTLSGGSSGASLVLGQGASGGGTFTGAGNGYFVVGSGTGVSIRTSNAGISISGGTNKSAWLGLDKNGTGLSTLHLGGGSTATGWDFNYGDSSAYSATSLGIYDNAGGAYRAVFTSTGNVLLGTTTDSGNGKLQLATGAADKTSGIGFGTDTSLYRTSTGRIAVDALTASTAFLELNVAGAKKGEIAADASNVYVGSAVGGLNTIIRSGAGTTALTLDSSQNATFAGAIAIGNTVNTVSPTSPNRTITMVIGGTTYYIAAKTTND